MGTIFLNMSKSVLDVFFELHDDAFFKYETKKKIPARSKKTIFWHKISHFFFRRKYFFIGNLIAMRVGKSTGIYIHPLAEIGKVIFLPLGSGIYIDFNVVLFDNVIIYDGVYLSYKGEKENANLIVESNVEICQDSIILTQEKIPSDTIIIPKTFIMDILPNYTTKIRIVRDKKVMIKRVIYSNPEMYKQWMLKENINIIKQIHDISI